jgi:hypothetical protein
MKTPILLAVVLSGCGANVWLEPAQRTSLVSTSTSSVPVDCPAICGRVKPQLERDFGFTEAEVDCSLPAFTQALDCSSCDGVFRGRFGVALVTCQ